ncbi:hypothetical protein OPV22_028207 [Ensete ventricosum]|uniref:Uncharacterized protein n=1 Tax=Ensete ventricosum TaxID=4639 RepID=A0AAV8Q216_ENSVE|nr:hypothetical protein OPV22_028207 [Ensete ventricosum]
MARLTSDETEKGETGKILITLSISNYIDRYQDTNIKGTKPDWRPKKCFSASLISLRWVVSFRERRIRQAWELGKWQLLTVLKTPWQLLVPVLIIRSSQGRCMFPQRR